jgi:hypothetical protein
MSSVDASNERLDEVEGDWDKRYVGAERVEIC